MDSQRRTFRWYVYEASNRLALAAGRIGGAAAAAAIDWILPWSHVGTSQAMNGQRRRQEVTCLLLSALRPKVIVETGTWRAITTRFFAEESDAPILTAELDERHHRFATWKTRPTRHQIELVLSDSRTFLRSLPHRSGMPKTRAFFYLDAHWYADLPLHEELTIIADHWSDSVVMIDDFQVPDDPGYGYDRYETGEALTPEYVPWEALDRWTHWWPASRSERETGARRGALVLVQDSVIDDGALVEFGLRPGALAERRQPSP